MTIADAGPIVSLLNPSEPYHHWCIEAADPLAPPLLTCEAVLTESFHLLERRTFSGAAGLRAMLERGFLKASFSLEAEIDEVLKLLEKYADQPMSLADACLVRMSELYPDHRVFTLDSDFRSYRRFGRRVIPLLTP